MTYPEECRTCPMRDNFSCGRCEVYIQQQEKEKKEECEKMTEQKIKRVLNLEEAIRHARILKDEEKLTELCILMTLERIEDRLGTVAFLLKQGIKDMNRKTEKKP